MNNDRDRIPIEFIANPAIVNPVRWSSHRDYSSFPASTRRHEITVDNYHFCLLRRSCLASDEIAPAPQRKTVDKDFINLYT